MKVHSQALDAYVRTSVLPVGGSRAVAQSTGASAEVASSESARITISAEARAAASSHGEIDEAKVAALRAQIAEGTYRVNSQILAARLLEKLG